jgi:hypothetical protein
LGLLSEQYVSNSEWCQKMLFRLTLLLGILSAWNTRTIAQDEVPTEPAVASSQKMSIPKTQILLEMRQPILSDAFVRLLHEHRKLKEVPSSGGFCIFDTQQARVLVSATAGGNRESTPDLVLKLDSGQQYTWSLLGPRNKLESDDFVLATLTNDKQNVQIDFAWAKRKENRQPFLPPTSAVVPLGSHLVIHTGAIPVAKSDLSVPIISTLPPLTELDDLTDKLLGTPKPKAEYRQQYLVVTPSIVEQEPEKAVRK